MLTILCFLTLNLSPPDSVTIRKSDMLLLDMDMQIEVTNAINDMYNFEFDEAEEVFIFMRFRYPEHPLPYFLMGLSQWWRIVPNINVKSNDEEFEKWLDLSIEKAEKLYDKDENNIEARFFLAAAYAFKGRLYSERGYYSKATWAGKNTLSYFELENEQNDLSPEFAFGDGLYYYYSEWIRENYGWLKPVLSFFPDGDKEKGIQKLKYVANNAFYTRTEAQMFLVHILAENNQDPKEALRIAEYLNFKFPNNAYFHRQYARMLYQYGRYREVAPVCNTILQKLDSGYYGYEANSGRYATFFLGQYYELINKKEEAMDMYMSAVEFGEQADAEDAGYHIYALLRIGKLYEDKGNKRKAKDYYKQARRNAKSGHQAKDKAKEYLREL